MAAQVTTGAAGPYSTTARATIADRRVPGILLFALSSAFLLVTMLAASIVWDERTLSAFLRDPAGYVPGNHMVSPGVRDPRTLADLVFYLGLVSRPGAREGRPE